MGSGHGDGRRHGQCVYLEGLEMTVKSEVAHGAMGMVCWLVVLLSISKCNLRNHNRSYGIQEILFQCLFDGFTFSK